MPWGGGDDDRQRADREAIAVTGRSLLNHGYAHGGAGNISVRTTGGILMTPTGTSLGAIDPERLSLVTLDGVPVAGDAQTKEAAVHLAVYAARPSATAIVHLYASIRPLCRAWPISIPRTRCQH